MHNMRLLDLLEPLAWILVLPLQTCRECTFWRNVDALWVSFIKWLTVSTWIIFLARCEIRICIFDLLRCSSQQNIVVQTFLSSCRICLIRFGEWTIADTEFEMALVVHLQANCKFCDLTSFVRTLDADRSCQVPIISTKLIESWILIAWILLPAEGASVTSGAIIASSPVAYNVARRRLCQIAMRHCPRDLGSIEK